MCRATVVARHHRMQRTMAGRVTAAVHSLWRATAARGAPTEAWAAGAGGCAVVARGGSGSRSRLRSLLEEVCACHEACDALHAQC